MKKFVQFGFCVIMLCIFLAMSVSAVGTYWTFDDPDATVEWADSSTNNVEISQADGAMVISVLGDDPYLAHSLTEDEQFDAAAFPYVKVRYKITNLMTITSEFFWGTDINPGPAANTNKQFDLTGDEEWAEYVVNISDVETWAGKVSTFRVDPIQGNILGEETIYIDYIAFFATEEEAIAWTEDSQDTTAAEETVAEETVAETEAETEAEITAPAETVSETMDESSITAETAPVTFDPIVLTIISAVSASAVAVVFRKKK